VKLLLSTPMQSARCQWNRQKKKANIFECSSTSCLKANKPITPFQKALKQVHIDRALSGALTCSPHPSSAGLICATRLLSSSVAIFFLTSLGLRRHSESLLFRLCSAMSIAAGYSPDRQNYRDGLPKRTVSQWRSSSSENYWPSYDCVRETDRNENMKIC